MMQPTYSSDPSPPGQKLGLPAIAVPPQYALEESDSFSPSNLISLIRRRWWVILLVAIAAGGFSLKRQLDKPPVYQSSFQILVTPPERSGADSLLNIQGLSNLTTSTVRSNEDYFTTQSEILRSNKLLEPVWDKIYANETAAGRTWMSYSSFVRSLVIARLPNTSIIQVNFQDIDQQRVKEVLETLATTYLDFTQQEQKRIEGEKLGFVGEQLPQFREKVDGLQRQLLALQQKHQFFDPASTGADLSARLVAVSARKTEVMANVEKLTAKKQFIEKQTGISNNTEAFRVSSLSQSPTYSALIAQLNGVNTELAKATAIYTEDTSPIKTLREQRSNLLKLIQQEVARQPTQAGDVSSLLTSAEIAGPRAAALQDLASTGIELEVLTIELNDLIRTEAQLKNQLQNFTSVAGQYTSLQQELELQRAGLNKFLEAKQSLEIEVTKSFTPWRLISTINLPDQPLSTLPRDILQSLLIGLVAGAAVAFLVDKLDPRYHSLDQIQADLRKTILGTIPFEPKLRSCLKNNRQLKSTSLFEAYSKLYSNLFFLGRKQSCRAFVITSAESRDGKSTTAFFLAQAASKLGQKVLLIDGDRYFPQEKNWKGLAAVTNSSGGPSTAASSPSPDLPDPSEEKLPEPLSDKLFYYKVPDNMMNPDQLVSSSQKFDRQMKQWRETFDLILIDTPPLLGLTDSRLIADQTDGVVLVVRLEKTRKESIKVALEELVLADLNILGVVANGVSAKSGGYGYYSNYYNRYYRKYALSQKNLNGQTTGQSNGQNPSS